MTVFRTLLATLALTLGAISAQAQADANPDYAPTAPVSRKAISYPRTSLGVTLGWGAPYGWGVDISQMLASHIDINAGVGLGVGFKIGVGTRYYFTPSHRVSPFVGLNLSRTGASSNVHLTVNNSQNGTNDEIEFTIQPTTVVHVRGGVRCQFRKVGLIGALGYGIGLGGDPVSYSPYYTPLYQSTRDVVDAIAPGGFEISAGVTFKLAD